MGEEYQTLFTDLAPRDAASVVSELDRLKVDYQLDQGGAQILVPASSVYDVRLKLMGSGVPLTGGVGFEIFDNTDFGMTEFAQRINYQRALEGELTRTITSLQEVKYARVHLVIPEKSLFQQAENSPSASVTLFLKAEFKGADQSLDSAQIMGIQRLVAAAVPNLKAARVTVTDQDGRTLSRQISEEKAIAAISERLQQKQSIEKYLAEKVTEVLDRAFGAGKAMVSVDAVLDFSEIKRTREHVLTPDENGMGGVIRRRETRLGSDSAQKDAEGNITTEVEYKLGRSVEQSVEIPGKIMRLSVGVIVPSDTTETRRRQIRNLVEMAVGIDSSRGDAVAVYAISQTMEALSAAEPVPLLQATEAETFEPRSQDRWVQDRLAGDSQPEQSIGLKAWINEHEPVWLGAWIAALILIAVFGLLIVRSNRKPGATETNATDAILQQAESGALIPALSHADRERALEKIRHWLEQTDIVDSREAGR